MIWCFRGKIPETAYYNAIMNIDRFLATRPEEKEPLAEKEIRPVAMVCTILGIKSIFDGTSTEAPAPYFNQLRKGGTVLGCSQYGVRFLQLKIFRECEARADRRVSTAFGNTSGESE